MKLGICFGMRSDPYAVDWNSAMMDFHHYFTHNGDYWQWTVHDTDPSNFQCPPVKDVDMYLLYGKCHKNAVPLDMFGNIFPVYEFKNLFQINYYGKECECGAEKTHGKNTSHVTWCPKWRKM